MRKRSLRRFASDWNEIYRLTDDEFEELVWDRLVTMGLQAFRTGRSNRKDGGIDIVFWTLNFVPCLGAVQVKHHRSPGTNTSVEVVRDFAGAMLSQPFQVGIVITNTAFTQDAIWFAEQNAPRIKLRDGDALRRWTANDFISEPLRSVVRSIKLCPGVEYQVPHFT